MSNTKMLTELIELIDDYAEVWHRCGGIYNAKTEAARKSVIEALSWVQALSAAPAGWKLVPVEPTNDMQKAADEWAAKGFDWPKAVYRAMLAASPTPPAEQAAPKAAPASNESAYQRGYMDGMAKGRRDAEAAPQPAPAGQQVASSAVLKAIREANMQLVRTGDDAFMLVPCKVATTEAVTSKAGATTGAASVVTPYAVYAPMPRAAYIEFDGREETAWHTPDQMRDFADRTHALRMEQATPKAAPGEPGWWRKRADEIEVKVALTGNQEAMRCYTDMRALLQAVTKVAHQQDVQQGITPETGNSVPAQGAAITSESGAVYAELPEPTASIGIDDAWHEPAMRDFADRTHALRMEQAAPKAAPVVWLSSKQLRGVTALHGQYLPFRCQPEGRFDTPVYLVEAAPKAAPGEPVHGDVLPPVGSRVYIRHGRDNDAHACTVTGYYAWGDLGGDKRLHRVFVRLVYEGTDRQQARMLCDCYPTTEAALAEAAPQQEAPLIPKGESAASKLRAMAANYPEGHLWDKLDSQVCAQGAMEIEALRAAPQQEAQEPTAFIHWPINGPPRLVWYSQKALNDAILKTHEDGYKPDVKLYTAPHPAPAPLSDAIERYLESQDALDNREYAGINAESYEKLIRRRNTSREDLDAALAAQGGE